MDKNQHKDLDNFFQNKLNDRQFEYQDDFWAEMETLLPEEDTDTTVTGNSRRFIGGILLLLLIGFMAWFSYPFAIPSSKKQSQTTLKTKSSEAINETVQSNDLSTESIILKNKQNNTNQKNTNTAIIQPIDIQSDRKILTKTKTTKYNKSNEVIDEATDAVINNFEKNVQPPNQLLNNKNGRPFPTNIIEESTKKTIVKNKNKQPLAAFNNEAIIDENQKNNITERPDLLNSNVKKEVVTVVNNNKNNQLSAYTYLTTFSLEDIIKKEPNEVSRIEPTCDGCPHLPSLKSLDIGLIAGLSASQGWKNTLNNRANPSLDPSIGLRLEYASNPIAEWTWNAEVLYWSRSSLNAQYGYDSTSYGFGATTVSRSINIEELHNIALPIYAVYNKDKHQFMGGLNFNYIINAQSTTTGTGSFYNANDIENFDVPTTEQWGYTSAFNRFEVGLTVGYDYEVRKGWRLGTRINYGLTDVAKNNVFNSNTFDNNLNIRLLLTCDLLEFQF